MHNSRRPLDRLSLTLTLTFEALTFDLIFIDGRDIAMDYLCVKFGNFFSRFGFIVRTDRQNHKQNAQRRMIAIFTRLPSALSPVSTTRVDEPS